MATFCRFPRQLPIFATLISSSKHGGFLPSHNPVHSKGKWMSPAMIGRRALEQFVAADSAVAS
jgi:hypothetical protein